MTKLYFRNTSAIPSHQLRGMKGGSVFTANPSALQTISPADTTKVVGMGLANSVALQNLTVKPHHKKAKNINFSL